MQNLPAAIIVVALILAAALFPGVYAVQPIHREEGFFDNNTHLSHEKFVRSFEVAGFKLQENFFDYLCGGILDSSFHDVKG